jgi:signal transduction histidine kinase
MSELNSDHRALLAVVAHELKSPLAAILGYQELMAEGLFGPLDPRADEAVRRIGSSARQLVALIDGMQDLAAAATASAILEDIDLNELVRDACSPLEAEFAARDIQVDIDAPQPVVVRADPARLRRTLDLCLGAVIRTSAGKSICVQITSPNAHALIRIAGTGLDPERDPAAPAAGSRTGAGLRLAMAARAVEPLGASLELTRQPDDQVTLDLTFPAALPGRTDPSALVDTLPEDATHPRD